MFKFIKNFLLIQMILCVGFALLLGSCSTNSVSPTSSNADRNISANWVPPPSGIADIDRYLPPNVHLVRSTHASEMRIERSFHREKRLFDDHRQEQKFEHNGYGTVFNPGTVPYDMVATMDVPDETAPFVEFGPHGTYFRQPIRIEIPFDSVGLNDCETISIFYWNGETQCYQAMPCVYDAVNHLMVGYTDHFSRYLIAKIETSVIVSG